MKTKTSTPFLRCQDRVLRQKAGYFADRTRDKGQWATVKQVRNEKIHGLDVPALKLSKLSQNSVKTLILNSRKNI